MYATGDKDILLVNSKKCAPAGTRHSATMTIVNRRRDLSSTAFSRDESTSALKTRRAVIYPDCESIDRNDASSTVFEQMVMPHRQHEVANYSSAFCHMALPVKRAVSYLEFSIER